MNTFFSYNKTRALVIQLGVNVEEAVSILLCKMLDIDLKNNVAFGTSSFALSFNNKITLLSDLKILGKNEKLFFEQFMQIRNKFAHVKAVDSFVACHEILAKNSPFIKLKKEFENTFETEEQLLNEIFRMLYVQIQTQLFKMVFEIANSANNKAQDKLNAQILKQVVSLSKQIILQKKLSIAVSDHAQELAKLLSEHKLSLAKEEQYLSYRHFIESIPSLYETMLEI